MKMTTANKPLLTIAIPTFNRLDCLRLLVESLSRQIEQAPGLAEKIELLIADNCSTDGTSTYINGLKSSYLVPHTHKTNLGADYNVRYCFKQARGQYVWIIGDDDLPKINSVIQIITILAVNQPDLLHLESRWITGPLDLFKQENLSHPLTNIVDSEGFALSVGTFVTFVSGMVVNKKAYQEISGEYDILKFAETSLPQLEWVLSLLCIEGTFVIMGGAPLLARAGNTGGYKVLDVFAVNYPKIIRDVMGETSELRKILIERHILGYLPGLIWTIRFSYVGEFDDRINFNALKSELKGSLLFWLFVAPMTRLPKPLAYLFLKASQLLSKVSVAVGTKCLQK